MRVVTLHSKSRQTAVARLDFLRFNNQVLDLKKAVGKCMKVEFVNVRGTGCKNCNDWINRGICCCRFEIILSLNSSMINIHVILYSIVFVYQGSRSSRCVHSRIDPSSS